MTNEQSAESTEATTQPVVEGIITEQTIDCRECGAAIRRGATFCPTCGTRQAEIATETPPARSSIALPLPPEQAAVAAPQPTSGAPVSTPASSTAQQTMLLPSFPCRLVWSPRKAWTVTTSLPDEQIADLFVESVTKPPNMVRRSRNYFRRVSWHAQRNAISGEIVATCRPNGPITIGFGSSKSYIDVSGDTIVCRVDRANPDAQTNVTVGVGSYTSWNALYAFPPTVYTYDVVKALRQADRTALVHYPWSVFRIVLLAAFVVMLIGSAAGG